jgi:serine/threonine-protein kinase HipA
MSGQHLGFLDGSGPQVRLGYDRDLDSARAVPLSLSLPLTKPRHRGRPVSNWLTGLLPDRETVLMGWRAQFGITDLHPESLLTHIGEDVAGACQFVREERLEAFSHPGSLTPLAADQIADIIRAAKRDSLPRDDQTSTGRFSLPGAQVKLALQRVGEGQWALPTGSQPSTHIFKPAIPGFEDQDVTEVVSMRTAAAIGLPTARTFITDFDGERVVGIERYDRVFAQDQWWRIHQEDLCQASGLDPRLKYESQGGPGVSECGQLIRRHCGQTDVETFARSIIYNYLIKGSDAHARNYSLLVTPGDVRLAPVYDLNATLSLGEAAQPARLAMAIGGESRFAEIGIGNWRLFASALQLDDDWVLGEVVTMAERLPELLGEVCASPDLAGLADATLERLQHQAARWLRSVRPSRTD